MAYKSHGQSHTLVYRVWQAMIQRCENPRCKSYRHYGGRGIVVCDRWRGESGFEHFLADMGERPDGLTLDRIDNDGNYEPDNCRWATYSEQNANRRPRKRQSHCMYGHELAGDNLTKDLKCRACRRERSRRHYMRQRSILPAGVR